jgi:hypothetical protein
MSETRSDGRAIMDAVACHQTDGYTGEVVIRVVMERGVIVRVGIIGQAVQWMFKRGRPPKSVRVDAPKGPLLDELEP